MVDIPIPPFDENSPAAIAMRRTIARPWYCLNPKSWSTVPWCVVFRPDGTGEIVMRCGVVLEHADTEDMMKRGFRWRLTRDSPLGMEASVVDRNDLFDTIPKLLNSTEAWTRMPFNSGGSIVPIYLRLELEAPESTPELGPIQWPFLLDSSNAICLPAELIDIIMELASLEDVAAAELLGTCRRSRKMVMRRRRKDLFPQIAQHFAENGMAAWIECGHFAPNSSQSPPTSFYAFEAMMFKYPYPCGYQTPDGESEWAHGWERRKHLYYSKELSVRHPTMWDNLLHWKEYDSHPEIEKFWTLN